MKGREQFPEPRGPPGTIKQLAAGAAVGAAVGPSVSVAFATVGDPVAFPTTVEVGDPVVFPDGGPPPTGAAVGAGTGAFLPTSAILFSYAFPMWDSFGGMGEEESA